MRLHDDGDPSTHRAMFIPKRDSDGSTYNKTNSK